jgi:hypothetical protein
MNQKIYVVHAFRYGERESHNYAVGAFSEQDAAIAAARAEEDYRGGKYDCEVLEWTLDKGTAGGNDENEAKVIKRLPPISRRFAT